MAFSWELAEGPAARGEAPIAPRRLLSPRKAVSAPGNGAQKGWGGKARWLAWNSGNAAISLEGLRCHREGEEEFSRAKSAYSSPELIWRLSKTQLFEEVKLLLSMSLF